MKKISLFAFMAILSIHLHAERIALSEVSEVIEMPNLKQKQIYDSSKVWLAKSFNSSNSVIQYDDSENGTIIGKGNMKYPCKGVMNCLAKGEYRVLFTIKIDTKDQKARLTFDDLLLKTSGVSNSSIRVKSVEIPIYEDADKVNIEEGIKEVIAKYKNEVISSKNNNDW